MSQFFAIFCGKAGQKSGSERVDFCRRSLRRPSNGVALLARGAVVDNEVPANSNWSQHRFAMLDLTAQSNPSGSIIVVDANLAPYVSKPFLDMKAFFDFANGPENVGLHTLTVTGVGSSAFGSVAFAWDVSKALGEPVAAIVPGYGLADVVPQALGGWLGFEMYDAIQSVTQEFLANFAPTLAMMGKDLARSTPGRVTASTGAPVFRHGSAASDDVHAILRNVRGIARVVGHSKGALAIENALRSLPSDRTRDFGSHIRLSNFRGCSLQTVLSISWLDRRTWILEFAQ